MAAKNKQLDPRAEGVYAKWVRYPDGQKQKDYTGEFFQIEQVNGDQSVDRILLTRDNFLELLQGMNFLKTSKAK